MHTTISDSTDARLRMLLVCFLLGAYLLVYIPRPSSADGDAVLAVAASTLREGSPNIDSMAYLDWLLPLPASRMGAFGVDGALYAKKGVTPSLFLLPLVALADALPPLTTRATAMLLNPLVTAATAALLYSLVRRLAYRPRVAFVTALLYGLATFALVYTKTLFGEPLAALLLLAAVLLAHRFHTAGNTRDLVAAGTALGLMVGVNVIYGVMIPIIGIALFALPHPPAPSPYMERGSQKRRADLGAVARRFVFFAAPIAVCLVLLGLYNWARFGSPLSSGYHFAEGEGFTRPILTGLYGLFISPFRGLFPYNPVLLLAIPGWFWLWRRAPRLAWLALVLVAADALAFASWWSWHGGIVWGPRFLIPVTPLFALALAPVVDWVIVPPTPLPPPQGERGNHVLIPYAIALLQVWLVLLVILSFGVQLLGALYNDQVYNNGYLNALYWTGEMNSAVTALQDVVLYSPPLSPIVGQAAMAWAGLPLQAAWAANGVNGLHLLAALALMAVGLLALVRRLKVRWAGVVAALVAVAALYIVAALHGGDGDDYDVRALSDTLQPRGTVVAATTLYGSALVDLEGQRVVTMNAPTTPDDVWAQQLWDYAKLRGGRLWLLTWFGAGDPANWQERDLWETASYITTRDVPGHRAVLFDLSPCECAMQAGGWTFGDAVRLERYGLARDADTVRVSLEWSSPTPPDEALQWFVHLLDANGAIVAQQDRAPQGGYAPVQDWAAGETVTDHLAFLLPSDADTSGWRLRVGWVRADGSQLAVVGADGEVLDEPFVLLNLESGD